MQALPSDRLDLTFAALAHPTRRSIVSRLAREGSATVSELAEPFDVSLMAISKHLKVMEKAGIVRRERDGRVLRCSPEPEALGPALTWITDHHQFWSDRLDALVRVFEKPDNTTRSKR